MKKNNILIISFSNIASDPRVQRQIQALRENSNLVVLGFGTFKSVGIEFLSISPPGKRKNKYLDALLLLFRQFEFYYSRLTFVKEAQEKISGKSFDLVIANDIEALPLAFNSVSSRVWYDAHEYAPRENEESIKWRLFFQPFKLFLCRKYMPKANIVTTVCDSIATEYSKLLGIEVEVIRNCPEFHSLAPSLGFVDKINLIHHGASIKGRKLEFLIDLMRHLDKRFHLYLMLTSTDPEYLEELKIQARIDNRIKFLEPVEMKEIPKFINQFDLGIYFLKPLNFNQKYALPNKLFEFIQGRLGIIIGPSVEMSKIVNNYKLGMVTKNFNLTDIAEEINALTYDKISSFKAASHNHAIELSFEGERNKIIDIASRIINDN